MARHRRPVNVRDDGLPAVLGPLITVGGVERAVLLDVDSGMVLDAWARGEASSSDSAVPGTGSRDHGPASGAGSAQSDETVPDGAMFGAGSAPGIGPEPGGASFGPGSVRSDETVPDGVARPGFGSLWRSLLGDHPADPGVDRTEAPGDVEAFGARHADLVRALLALPGSPPAELSLVVDDRHHLVRCVADPGRGAVGARGRRRRVAVGRAAGSPSPAATARRRSDHRSVAPLLGRRAAPPTPWPSAEHRVARRRCPASPHRRQALPVSAARPRAATTRRSTGARRRAVRPQAGCRRAVDGRHPARSRRVVVRPTGGPLGAVEAAPADSHPLADGVPPPPLGEPWCRTPPTTGRTTPRRPFPTRAAARRPPRPCPPRAARAAGDRERIAIDPPSSIDRAFPLTVSGGPQCPRQHRPHRRPSSGCRPGRRPVPPFAPRACPRTVRARWSSSAPTAPCATSRGAPDVDVDVEPVAADTEDGRSVIRHSAAHVLAQAVQQLRPDAKLGIGPPITDGFYYDFDVDTPFTPEDLTALEAAMKKIIKAGQRFSRRRFDSVDDARKELADEPYKLELIDLKGCGAGRRASRSTRPASSRSTTTCTPTPARRSGRTSAAARTCPPRSTSPR